VATNHSPQPTTATTLPELEHYMDVIALVSSGIIVKELLTSLLLPLARSHVKLCRDELHAETPNDQSDDGAHGTAQTHAHENHISSTQKNIGVNVDKELAQMDREEQKNSHQRQHEEQMMRYYERLIVSPGRACRALELERRRRRGPEISNDNPKRQDDLAAGLNPHDDNERTAAQNVCGGLVSLLLLHLLNDTDADTPITTTPSVNINTRPTKSKNDSELQSGTETKTKTQTTVHSKDTHTQQAPDIHNDSLEIPNSRQGNLLPKYHTAWNAWCHGLSGSNTGNGASDVCLASHHTLVNNNNHNRTDCKTCFKTICIVL